MGAELILVRRQHVQTPVEAIIVDLGQRDSGDILQGRAFIPMLGNAKLAALSAESGGRQDRGDVLPRDILFARLDERGQECVEPKPVP